MARRKKPTQDKNPTADSVLSDCYQLNLPELKLVRDALDVLINWLEEEESLNEEEKKAASLIASQGTGKRGGTGYIEKKLINGCGPYLYLRLKRNGTHHSFYLGKSQNF
ncbi:hypothetical protein PCC7424_5491 (plasmid) [Gloeothece citriformis PCC 7424]|uniref:Uncharacterized protein n=1 Tax=Gloeothece citriformis (strain PCC 7424) TaxID=65393 RepID=B7KMN9_GLOC7|nr:hypothetical protein [Gloeothece citriformis]ACK74061.1 hypothetical protein PCC7424_5491 [Gloeothece citriformis PCC 7424]